ncbi:hypothetical protein ACKFKF_14205 [Phormidesmis sp. 146-12]
MEGNSASGIDFTGLLVDVKVTSVRQPQSSCPFKSARQKIFGLGYSLLVFVYDKSDNSTIRTATLSILHTIYVTAERTADFQNSNALQWRLQYGRALERAGQEEGVVAVYRAVV